MKFLPIVLYLALITNVIECAPRGANRENKAKVIEYLENFGYLPVTKNKNHIISAIQLKHGVKRLQVRLKIDLFIVLAVNNF
jgi:hypothetical protein